MSKRNRNRATNLPRKKPINTVEKGKRNEARCRVELISCGCEVWSPTWSTYQSKDIFRLFDVIAVSPGKNQLLFIQVKSNRCDKKTRERIKKFKMPKCCSKEIWIWKDRKGWVKEFYE